MSIWDGIKIKANGKDENNFVPSWKEEPIPYGHIIAIVESADHFNEAVSDVLNRLFISNGIEITPKVLKDIGRIENDEYPEQFLLIYKGITLGLVYITTDMFSTFIHFNSDYKNFIVL